MVLRVLTNFAYLPLTIHWSLENGAVDDVYVGLFGTIAAISQNILSWGDCK